MSIRPRIQRFAGIAIAFVAVTAIAAGCTGDDEPERTEPSVTVSVGTPVPSITAASSAEATSTAEPTAAATTEPAIGDTISANDASIGELTARFEDAGIAQAARWAREVDEYRPYSADDADYNKLRGELAKYNPGPGVVDAIIATLHLP